MREALYLSCSLQKSRSKCRAEGLDQPVYIGLGVGLRIHQTPGQSGTANFHWSVGHRQIRGNSTPLAAWQIWGCCPAGLTGSLVLERWNWMGLLGADWPSAHHD